MEEKAFDALIADFYRAATGEIAWQQPLAGVQRAFNASFALLNTSDMVSGRMLRLDNGRTDVAEGNLHYLREYHRIDPRKARTLALGAAGFDQWHHCHETFSDDFVAQHRFYRDFTPAYGIRYCAHIAFPVEPTVFTALAIELAPERGPLNVDERELARRLGQHMRDALRAHQRMRTLLSQALAGHTLLSNFAYPMWLLDVDRFIAFENPAAAREVERADRFARRGSGLALIADHADRQLTERLHTLAGATHGASAVLDLRSRGSDPPSWLHLSLVIPGAALGVFGDRPQVLATVFTPGQVSQVDTLALTHLFGLTPAEAKVAARLADGMSASQIATAHGNAEATVRTQISQVLVKLGAKRVVDVVRILRQGETLWSAGSR